MNFIAVISLLVFNTQMEKISKNNIVLMILCIVSFIAYLILNQSLITLIQPAFFSEKMILSFCFIYFVLRIVSRNQRNVPKSLYLLVTFFYFQSNPEVIAFACLAYYSLRKNLNIILLILSSLFFIFNFLFYVDMYVTLCVVFFILIYDFYQSKNLRKQNDELYFLLLALVYLLTLPLYQVSFYGLDLNLFLLTLFYFSTLFLPKKARYIATSLILFYYSLELSALFFGFFGFGLYYMAKILRYDRAILLDNEKLASSLNILFPVCAIFIFCIYISNASKVDLFIGPSFLIFLFWIRDLLVARRVKSSFFVSELVASFLLITCALGEIL